MMGLIALTAALVGSLPSLEVNVMSFNIRYGTANDGPDAWLHRRAQVLAMLKEFRGDFIALQEALDFQVDEILEAIPHTAFIGVGRDDGERAGEFSAVIYATDRWEAMASGTFWLSDTPDVVASKHWGNRITRICTWGRFRHRATGRTVLFGNAHWDHESQPSRERSAIVMADRLARARQPDEVVIVTGDFNAGERNAAVRYLLGERLPDEPFDGRTSPLPLVDTFRAVAPKEAEVGTFHAFKGGTGGDKIDYILVSPGVETLAASIDRRHHNGRYPSDHYPVTARLRIPVRSA